MDGAPEKYIKLHSQVVLECIIENIVEKPNFIFWYHDKTRIMDSVSNYKIDRIDNTGETRGRLSISKAVQQNSGNYTCIPTNLQGRSIELHILNGKIS